MNRREKEKMTEILTENEQTAQEISKEVYDAMRAAIEHSLRYEGFEEDAQVSLTIVDDAEIQRINREFRNVDRPTDVLSFPMLEFDGDGVADIDDSDCTEEGKVILGDIIISAERAKRQAEEYGHSFLREMAFLTVHSMLHLLGYDHVDDEEGEKIMIKKQKEILEELGITRA